MILKVRAFPICLMLLMTGCAHHTVTSDQDRVPAYSSIDGTGKDETVTWVGHTRTGAAYSQASYRQVLANQNTFTISDRPAQLPRYSNKPADVIERVSSLQSYSIYEMARWERYCGHGKMDEKDWEFVASQGRNNVPDTLKALCNPPAFSRQDYAAAWKRSCGGSEPSTFDQAIRSITVAPANICRD
jgi:hypothetical protein